MDTQTKKMFKELLQNEINPLLIGLRSEVEHLGKIFEQGQAVPVGFTFTKEAIESMKHHDGKTPVKGVDYFTDKEADEFLSKATPKKGVDYFNETDIAAFKAAVTPKKGTDYHDGHTPIRGTDYFTDADIKDFLSRVTPIKGVHYDDGKPGETRIVKVNEGTAITGEQIRNKLEALKGSGRLSIKAIKGWEDAVNEHLLEKGFGHTAAPQESGIGGSGGGGTSSTINGLITAGTNVTITGSGTGADPYVINASGGGGGGTWGSISGTLSDQTDLQAVLDTLVPYTGATTSVNLGSNALTTTGNVTGNSWLGSTVVRAGATGQFYWNGRSIMKSPSDGMIYLRNNADTAYSDLTLKDATGQSLTLADTVLAGSGSLAGSILSTTQTWNTSGSPTAWKLNVTNTASGASALLIDLQIGGTSQFKVDKAGVGTFAGALNVGGAITTSFNVSGNSWLGSTLVRAGATSGFSWNGRSFMKSSADGFIEMYKADGTTFSVVQSLYDRAGSGTPEGAVTAPVGAIYHRTDGGAGTSFYVKESGSGNTGWVAK